MVARIIDLFANSGFQYKTHFVESDGKALRSNPAEALLVTVLARV